METISGIVNKIYKNRNKNIRFFLSKDTMGVSFYKFIRVLSNTNGDGKNNIIDINSDKFISNNALLHENRKLSTVYSILGLLSK